MTHSAGDRDLDWTAYLPAGRPEAPPSPPDADSARPDEDDLFGDWEPRRVSRLTVVLAAAVLVVAGFAFGAVVAKRSAPATSATGAPGAATGGRFAGQNGASFGGGAGTRGTGAGGTAGTGGATGPAAGAGGSGANAAAPVVVGTVQSVGAGRLLVKNFAGAQVVVRVPAGTPVTTTGLTALTKGRTVSVQGRRAADGSVTATAIVSRS